MTPERDAPPPPSAPAQGDRPPPSSTQLPAPILSRARGVRWAAAAGVAALAVAVGLAVIVAGPKPGIPLPVYVVSVEGDPPPDGGTAGDLHLFRPGGRMTVTARPAEPLRGKVEVYAYSNCSHRTGGRVNPLDTWGTMTVDGTITVSAKTDDVFEGLTPGVCEITINLLRPGRFGGEPGGHLELIVPVSWQGPAPPPAQQ